ncbi:MAG: transglycosylase domain-containing protein [Steroidobacteraceae bacterium]
MKSRTIRVAVGVAASLVVLGLLALYAVVCSYVYLYPSLPSVAAMRTGPTQVPLRVYARNGELIEQIGERRSIPVKYEDIPPLVREAFLAAEDEHFFQHGGIDYRGMVRALFADLESGDFSQGASTITMQAAKNMFLTPDRTVRRKLQQVFVALRMEREFSKEEILNTYLNVIFFGQRAYGVAAAAEVYFGKSLSDLSVAEMATLAGIVPAPSRYNPASNPRAAAGRRHYVLQRMAANHFIDAATAARAGAEQVQAREYAPRYDVEAPYVAEMVRQEIVSRYGEVAINAGYRVITTIDSRLQTVANRALRLGLLDYDRRHGYRGPLQNVKFDAGATPAQLDALLGGVSEVAILQPSLVVSIAPKAARVYIRGSGFAEIDWDGLSWARTGNGQADSVLHRGDIVYVISDGKGNAVLAQLPEAQGAMVALDPDDGAITALVGGFDYYSNEFNRVTQPRRAPGSGFKPFLYSAALEHGFTTASIIMDAPAWVNDKGTEEAWRPKNSGGEFSGPMPFREALVHSRNYVSIRLLRSMGPDEVISYAARFGFDPAAMPHSESLALGTLQVPPIQVVTGYATFANGGYKVEPYFIDRIEADDGTVLYRAAPKRVCEDCPAAAAAVAPAAGTEGSPADDSDSSAPAEDTRIAAPAQLPVFSAASAAGPTLPIATPANSIGDTADSIDGFARLPGLVPPTEQAPRIITAANAWLMDDLMGDVIKRGTGIGARVLGRNDIGGKTGTTNDSRDAWFNGFDRHIVATVWVGFDQDRSLGETEQGSRTAVPIWVNFMREALRGVPDVPRPQPEGILTLRVSTRTGLLAAANDPESKEEYFLADHLPPNAVPGTSSGLPTTPVPPVPESSGPLF